MNRRLAALAAATSLIVAALLAPSSTATPHTVLRASGIVGEANPLSWVLTRHALPTKLSYEELHPPPPTTTTQLPSTPAKVRTTAAPTRHVSTYRAQSTPTSYRAPTATLSGANWCKQSAQLTANVMRWQPYMLGPDPAHPFTWPVSTMLSIMCPESGGDPNAVNPTSGACNLLQLLPCPGRMSGVDAIAYAYWQKYLPACRQPAWHYDCLHPWGH